MMLTRANGMRLGVRRLWLSVGLTVLVGARGVAQLSTLTAGTGVLMESTSRKCRC